MVNRGRVLPMALAEPLAAARRDINAPRVVAQLGPRGWPQIHHMATPIDAKFDWSGPIEGPQMVHQIARHGIGRNEIGVAMGNEETLSAGYRAPGLLQTVERSRIALLAGLQTEVPMAAHLFIEKAVLDSRFKA